MKTRFFALLLLAALAISLVAGCAAPPVILETHPVEERITEPSVPLTPIPTETAVPTEPAPAATTPVTQTTPRITKEEAIAIALADAGFTTDQVTRLRSQFDWDDRVPEYEVEFRQGDFEYDYEIHAETGAILFREKDWND